MTAGHLIPLMVSSCRFWPLGIGKTMTLPEIGDIITTKEALELCRYFGLDYLIDRIKSDPERYKDWKFDDCSGLPDEVVGFSRAVIGRTSLTSAVSRTTFATVMGSREIEPRESGVIDPKFSKLHLNLWLGYTCSGFLRHWPEGYC